MMPGKGLVLKPRQGARRGKRRFALASRKQQRGCLTHVAIVCDRPEMQPLLPQVVIGNHAVLPLYIQKEIEPHLHKHVFLVRRKSAWVDATYMITIMELLGKVLKPFLNKFQPILLMDALPAHIAPTVFCAAAKSGIWVVIVPAKLTWLLQPADTHLFYKYKMYLRKRYLESMARCEEGALQLRAVLKAINDAVRYVCQAHEWGKAFDGNGFGQRQRHVRRAIVEAGELNFPLCIPLGIPSLMQFRSIWPAGADIPLDAVFAPFLDPPDPCTTSRAAQQPPEPIPAPLPWLERLRPRRFGSFVFAPADGAQHAFPLEDIGEPGPPGWPALAAPQAAPPDRPRVRARAAQPIAASRPSAHSFARLQRPPGTP